PFATAVTTPVALTLATAGAEDCQVNGVPAIACPLASCAIAASGRVWPSATKVSAAGVTTTAATPGAAGWVGACSPPQAATTSPTTTTTAEVGRIPISWTTGFLLVHAHGCRAADRGPVAELPVGVVAPAVGGPRRRDPAGVADARAPPGEGHPARDRHRADPLD